MTEQNRCRSVYERCVDGHWEAYTPSLRERFHWFKFDTIENVQAIVYTVAFLACFGWWLTAAWVVCLLGID
jgi:hypothetical protein